MNVYFDNAATTKMSQVALDAMIPCLENVYANASSLHTPGQKSKEVLEKAREEIAACIGAQPNEIYFTSGGSEADNQAIVSAAKWGARRNKKTHYFYCLRASMQYFIHCRNWKKKVTK